MKHDAVITAQPTCCVMLTSPPLSTRWMGYWHEKVVVITGGSSGFGRSLAGRFADAGARVIIAARGLEQLEATAASIGGNVTPLVTDITDDESVQQLVAKVREQWGRIDAWINNAGRSSRGQASETSCEEFAELLDLNFLGAVRCSRAVIPELAKTGGHLVQIGSIASLIAGPHLGAYPASKFPLTAYSQQLRMELAPQGIHVLLVCPGPIARTDMDNRYDRESEGLPAAAKLPGGGARLKQLCPDQLSRKIMKACQRRKAELIIPWHTKVLVAIAHISPRLGERILNFYTRRG